MSTGRRPSRAARRWLLAAMLLVAGGCSRAALGASPAGLMSPAGFVHPPIARPIVRPIVEEPPTPAAAPVTARLPPATVIARFGAEVITASDLEAAVGAVQGPERLEYTSAGPLRELVEALVDQRLMAAAARKRGLDRDPAVTARLDGPPAAAGPSREQTLAREQILAEAYVGRELASVPGPTDAEVAAYYRDHAGEFVVPARVQVIRAVLGSEAAGERLRAELIRGVSFEQIQRSDPDHTLQVDRLWLQDLPRKGEMESVALALEPGEVSRVFRTATGYAVLRAEERAAARARPLGEVRPGIRARLEDEQRQAALARIRAELRKGAGVTIEEAALSAYLQPPPAGD